MNNKKNNKGFTFIELILYMAILAIFMVAVVSLMGSAIKSYRTMNARKQLQSSATETYDTISDMLMSAVDVKIYGTAYHTVTNAGVTSYEQITDALFVVPEDTWYTGDSANKLYYASGSPVSISVDNLSGGALAPSAVFDIATIKSFADSSVTAPSTDDTVMISVNSLYIRYASGLDDAGSTIYSECTISYDDAADKLYMYRVDESDATFDPVNIGKIYWMDSNYSSASNYVLCKNVSDFKLQVSPETGTFAVVLELDDNATSASYESKGVVSLRNSFVLKKHEWN